MTSRRATIRIPDFHMAEEVKDGQKKQYVVYHVLVSNGKWENKVYRRYTNFEEFHRAWGALYPALADKHQLPNNANLVIDNPKYILMNAAEKAEARRKKLEEYLRDTLAIDAILDFFVPFLECEKTDLKTKVAAVDEDLKPKAANAHAKDEEDVKTTASGLKIVSAIPQNEHLKVAKGNDGHATRKANKHKARFEAKYKDVIADPTAAISLTLTRADAPGGADAASPPLSPTGDGPAPPRPPPKPHKYGTAPTGAQALAAAKTAGSSAAGGSATVGASSGLLVTAVALFDFTPPPDKPDCIALKKDEQLTIVEQSSDDWWFGKRGDGKDGFFPANYVKIIKTSSIPKAPPPRPTAAAAFGGGSAAAGAAGAGAGSTAGGARSTLSVAQVKAVKRHSTPMNLTSSADKPVSLLSPAALAAARGVRSDDDEDDAPPKPKPPPRPNAPGAAAAAGATGAAGGPAIQKPARAATFQVGAGASAAADSAVKPRPPPPRPGAVSPAPPSAPAAPPAPSAAAVPPPRPPSGRAQPPPMSAALKSSIAATPALRPTPKPAAKPFGGIVASAAVAVNAGGNAGGAAALNRPPSASAIGRGPSPSVAGGPPKRPPPAPVATKFGAAAADGAGAASPQPASAGNKKFCTHCGKPVAAAAPAKPQTFCTHCGGKL